MAESNQGSVNGENINGNGNGNHALVMVDEELPIAEYAIPSLDGVIPGIVQPGVEGNFDLKPGMIQLLQSMTQYHGLPKEDPHKHITKFMKISDTFSVHGVSTDAMRMRLFPFSLAGAAEEWVEDLPAQSITTWKELGEAFLMRFFPPRKVCDLRDDITGFRQYVDESIHESWTRFKGLIKKCPTHGLPKWATIQIFYRGLSHQGKTHLDATANGMFLLKRYPEAFETLERISQNSCQWPEQRDEAPKKAAGLYEVTEITSMAAEMAAMHNTFKVLVKQMAETKQQPPAQVAQTTPICSLCYGAHFFEECPSKPSSAFYVGDYNKNYNNRGNYNQGRWQQQGGNFGQNQGQNYHQNVGNRNQNQPFQGGQQPYQPKVPFPPGFNSQMPQDQQGQSNAETQPLPNDQWSNRMLQNHEAMLQSHGAILKILETQMGKIASSLSNRPVGTLPSDTEAPRKEGKESCKALHLRNGREVEQPEHVIRPSTLRKLAEKNVQPIEEEEEPNVIEVQDSENNKEQGDLGKTEKSAPKSKEPAKPTQQNEGTSPRSRARQIPFPQRLQKQNQEQHFKRFLEILKQLQINIPFVEALQHMPSYIKFMKDILSRKRRIEEFETVALTKECSSIVSTKVPPKMEDPGSFTIPCVIGDRYIGRALCDLGSSINLMPASIFKQLGIKSAPTTLTLQLANRSIVYPEGKVENILVKVEKFIFPADFIILDCEVDENIPIIV
ncbi:uncharacterized protein LOC133287381 [Gastrolobium bilobum]|uniref:uncharacterized protein LOC133287381 n=1 Tax=Gastrolobium bilobum TaxID=150636 RepID=UPI002AAF2DDA|nr:uncharacterized protein LOC133287381 [Gastrolobium bilobum]